MSILAMVGMAGSGKSVVAHHLRERGIPMVRFGQIIIDEVQQRGLPILPRHERQVREELRARYGMDVCAQRSIPFIEENLKQHPLVAIDGLYSYSEYKTLRHAFHNQLVVVAVFTPRHVRYARLAERPERPLSRSEAEERDIAEIEKIEKGGPIALADYTLLNDGTPAALLAQVDALLATLQHAEAGGG